MRTHGLVVRGHEIPTVSTILHTVKEWAREQVTEEKVAAAVIVAGTLLAWGFLLMAFYQAHQNYPLARL